MALLKITTKPIEYEIKIERAKLVAAGTEGISPENIRVKQSPRRLQRTAEQIRTVEQAERNASNFQELARRNAGGQIRATAINATNLGNVNTFGGVPEVLTGTAATVSNAEESQLYREYSEHEMLSPDAEYIAEYGEYQSNVEIETFMRDSSKYEVWNTTKNQLEFIPGRFQMEITQYPEVIIEYTGGFQYVPPSSDPDFVEE